MTSSTRIKDKERGGSKRVERPKNGTKGLEKRGRNRGRNLDVDDNDRQRGIKRLA